ncbi:iron-containing alcohol dehydrogenase [Paenibacillus abyssi]|uniref:iron-containing alcohol dehydrogenase n=1 Tax=Paenibacillus abyssi TaxID=1340531 RepID=UPI001E30CA7E|nr:iron-containing alcohol dehydrogenase [Paenibacillus abyssi]
MRLIDCHARFFFRVDCHRRRCKSGAIFKIPHGLANALYLPYVIEFNKKADSKRYADIARMLGLSGSTDDQLVDTLTDLLRRLNKALNLPLTLPAKMILTKRFRFNLNAS